MNKTIGSAQITIQAVTSRIAQNKVLCCDGGISTPQINQGAIVDL